MYFRPLIVALAYTSAQDNVEKQVMFYVIKVKAAFIPLIMLLMALIVGGQPAFLFSGTGYIAAHLYMFFDVLYPSIPGGRRFWFVQTPSIFHLLFPTTYNGKSGPNDRFQQTTGFGTVVRPRMAGPGSSGSGGLNSATGNKDGANGLNGNGASTGFTGRFGFSSPFKGKGQRLGG